MADVKLPKKALKKSNKAKKPVFRLGDPYTAVKLPRPSADHQQAILDMLCAYLAPIGRHRAECSRPSKGGARARAKRRKIQAEHEEQKPVASSSPTSRARPPEIQSHITIGLNSTTRHLQSLAASSAPKSLASITDPQTEQPASTNKGRHMAVVFISESRSRLIYAHLPLLALTASAANPSLPTTRLVKLGSAADKAIADATGVARVGVCGLMDDFAPLKPLVDYVREHVKPVSVPWLRDAVRAKYREMNIEKDGPKIAEDRVSDAGDGDVEAETEPPT